MSEQIAVLEDKRHSRYSPRIRATQVALYLQTLEETGDEEKACLAAQITLRTVQRWDKISETFSKKRQESKQLAELVLLAKLEAMGDRTLLEKCDRIDDFAKLQNYRMFRVKRLDPRYRDNSTMNVLIAGPGQCVFEGMDMPIGQTPNQGVRLPLPVKKT